MAKYRKKPIDIEAFRFEGQPPSQWPAWASNSLAIRRSGLALYIDDEHHGPIRCNPGDWILKGVNGEIYPCTDDVFRKSYDEVAE